MKSPPLKIIRLMNKLLATYFGGGREEIEGLGVGRGRGLTDSHELPPQVIEVLWGQTSPRAGMEETVQGFREAWPLHAVRHMKRLPTLYYTQQNIQ